MLLITSRNIFYCNTMLVRLFYTHFIFINSDELNDFSYTGNKNRSDVSLSPLHINTRYPSFKQCIVTTFTFKRERDKYTK